MRINYTLNPTLKHRAVIRLAVAFWTLQDVKSLLQEDDVRYIIKTGGQRWSLKAHQKPEKWDSVESKVCEKVIELSLPNVLKEELAALIEPIGMEILTWGAYHLNSVGIFVGDCLSQLCWTSEGKINKKKTAKVLVKNENLSVIDRYKLACNYCLEEEIYVLWCRLEDRVLHGKNLMKIEECETPMVSFWSYYMSGGMAELEKMVARHPSIHPTTYDYKLPIQMHKGNHEKRLNIDVYFPYSRVYLYGLHIAVYNGNMVSVSYFLQKLPTRVREKLIVAVAESAVIRRCYGFMIDENFPNEYHSDVFLFLLSIMSESQQAEIFNICPRLSLMCLLDWPWQDFLIETAQRVLHLLTEHEVCHLLATIYDKAYQNYADYDYRKLFRRVWKEICVIHKEYLIRKFANGFLFPCLFETEDEETLMLLLSDTSVTQKGRLIFSNAGKEICIHLASGDKWNLLKLFLQKCVPSTNAIMAFKEELENYMHSRFPIDSISKCEIQWHKIAELIDDLAQSGM